MNKIVFATNNKKKLQEVTTHLSGKWQVLSLKDIGFTGDIAETGSTFHENAAIKANFISDKYSIDCFADDSGLEVEALNRAPGVYSARLAGEPANDDANNKLLLEKLKGVSNRSAQFVTVIALKLKDKIHFFEGSIRGKILEMPRGENGFGYDPLFVPDGFEQTFAEMSLDEKNKISHRAQAVNKLVDFLKNAG